MGVGRRAMPQFADRMWSLGYDVLWSEGYSYALSRALFDHLPVDVAAFTQFGFDHLGMHRSLANYWAAKERLFRAIVRPGGTVVLNPPGGGGVEDPGHRRRAAAACHHHRRGPRGGDRRRSAEDRGADVPLRRAITERVMIANLELAVAAGLALGQEPPALATGIETWPAHLAGSRRWSWAPRSAS